MNAAVPATHGGGVVHIELVILVICGLLTNELRKRRSDVEDLT